MFNRLRRSLLVLLTTITAYFLYAAAAVPWLEPSFKRTARSSSTAAPSNRSRDLDDLFADGAWELGPTKVIETDEGMLLFDDYQPLADGRLELTRCTLVGYLRDDRGGDNQAAADAKEGRRKVVLRAPSGATLMFDQALDILRGQFGRIVGGRLKGEVEIWSPATSAERNDAISLVTGNVQLDAQRIWTPQEVRFRYGDNSGQGRGLTITLSGGKRSSDAPSLGVGGLRALELERLDRLQLQMADGGLFGKGAGPAGPAAPRAAETAPAIVEVKCRGPCRFDFEQQLLTLEEQVELTRRHPSGLLDQLTCQQLELYFADPAALAQVAGSQDTPRPGQKKMGKLTPVRVVARGFPVTIRAATVGIGTEAELIEYDCIHRRIWLKGRDRVMFHDRQRRVEARELWYVLAEEGRLGELAALGPGDVRGTMGAPSREWHVRWQGQAELRRVDGTPVLSFESGVSIELADTGSFRAERLHVYLKEVPRPDNPDRYRIEPDRLHATRHVVVDTRQLSGEVDEAQIWFRSGPGESVAAADTASPGPLAAGSLWTGPEDSDPAGPVKKFDVRARLLKALVLLDKTPVAERLEIRDGLELREITPGETSPLVIRGDLFELQDGASSFPRGALLGQPAEIIARGMQARGEKIHVYPGNNRVQILGAGEMTVDPRRVAREAGPVGAASPALPLEQPARIAWQDQMEFDGQIATFDGQVAVNTQRPWKDGQAQFVALGERLRMQLTRPVNFQNPKLERGEPDTELAELGFEGWAFLEVVGVDQHGARTLDEQMQVQQLTINHVTGEIRGAGPGWLRGTHRGQDTLHWNQARVQPVSAPAPPSDGLNFLRVDFEKQLAGNLHRRQIEFLQGTRTLYGPVAGWDVALDQLPESELPPEAVLLTCERLSVAQPDQGGGDTDIELEATGNAYVRGQAFEAVAGRISYVKAKDQLILEGDGRNFATLTYHPRPGMQPSRTSATKMLFWLSTRQCQIIGLQPSEINNIGQQRGIRAA
ncbi:MAG: hypothetical protein AB7F89_21920, partial [Pirellulaceae bacterium]